VLVVDSTYKRQSVKRRLLREGIKQPRCEMCGQDESWFGSRMSLVLDHINGVPNDNRLENLRSYGADIVKQVGQALAAGEPREIRI
jgi:hypothetical protein